VRIHFEDWVFDSETREVLRSGRAAAVSPLAFRLLETLIRERPRALDRRQIQKELWPGMWVSEANLPNVVAELRRVLGDKARQPRIIRTVRGFGYAFRAEATIEAAAEPPSVGGSVYRLIWGNREIALEAGENPIGRSEDSVVWVDDSSVSRRHARIRIDRSGAVLEDMGSKNGTLVGGKRVSGSRRLADKDSIQIGPASLVFRVFHRAGTTSSKTR
jgi:DNA-binding winged helix-turn-helix (wHTH) protein